jgi:hypothetical protein
MMRALSKQLIVQSAVFVLAIALGVTTSEAQQKTRVSGSMTMAHIKYETINVNEADNHTISLYVFEGVNQSTGKQAFMDGASLINIGTSELVKGNGSHQGYARLMKGADTVVSKWSGNVTAALSAEGRPRVTFAGTFSYTTGTGQFKNIQGTGTYKGKYISSTIATVEWEGEYSVGGTAVKK